MEPTMIDDTKPDAISALRPLGLDYPVVAVKFSTVEPRDLPRLSKRIAFCEMLKEAHQSGSFYATRDEQGCAAGSYVLGQIDHDPLMESGQIGPIIGVYGSQEANRRVYTDMIRLPVGASPYTLFARLDDAAFDPDLLVVTARPHQAEVIMRAYGYNTGAAWQARGTSVIGCASLYAYPHVTGTMNILISGLHHGMRARQLFPEGLLFIAIPARLIPEIAGNLATMAERGQIDLPQYHWGKEAHESYMRTVAESLAREKDA
jgi:uncharacterized protein (DUF169 family)